jgi:hypothetical protein
LQHFLGVSATLIIGGMWFVYLRQLAVAAWWSGSGVSLLWALIVQVAASTPQTKAGLLAVCPDMDELLTVVALCKPVLSFVHLYLDGNVAEAGQLEKFLGLRHSG